MEWEPSRETDKLNEFMAVFSILWICLLVLAVLCSVCGLWACSGAGAAVGPSPDETAVVGTWAGPLAGPADTLLIGVRIAATHAYALQSSDARGVLEEENGTWTIRGNHWFTSPTSCNQADQAGGTMRPITCTGGDSLLVNISGNRWDIDFPSGGRLIPLHLVKI